MEEPADPVCDRSTGPLTGGSGAPSGRPGGNRAATGQQPEKHQDNAKELRSLIRSDRPLDRAVRSASPVNRVCRGKMLSCSVELWEIILHGYREPQDPDRLTSTEFYNRQLNASARDKIRSGINRKLLDQVDDIVSAKELWDRIVVLQEGTDLIQSSLYETAKQEAYQFMIRDGESVFDAYARLGALKVRIKGLGAEKYNDGFEMNEAFIKSKVIAMIAVKQEDTNIGLNLQIMTKSADLNSDDLVSYVAANENMAKAGKRLKAMNRVDEASHNHEASHNLALKARADHGGEEAYEIEEDEEMTSTSDIATDFARDVPDLHGFVGRRVKLHAEKSVVLSSRGRKFRPSSRKFGQGRKFRSGPEVPARRKFRKFRPSSESRPFPCSNIRGPFRGLSELGRNLGGSSDRAEVPVPRGGSSGPMLFLRAGGHLGGILEEYGRKFRSWGGSSGVRCSSVFIVSSSLSNALVSMAGVFVDVPDCA
ncbi:hypothetical protein QYE76_003121 [Lolium multiflorum]|uniref:Uncharacterized protein n=1 Tax=Lolium multiflorum TaxID=4521 RepID=A0AAD8RN39_LOLMU|nr:hypothetical protein QYE76_003121 [Lolium multiflorum]